MEKTFLIYVRDLSGVAQWKRVGLITQRSEDRNLSPLLVILFLWSSLGAIGSTLELARLLSCGEKLTTVGLEPTIFGSEDRRLIHYLIH